jgi:hypothetical protein
MGRVRGSFRHHEPYISVELSRARRARVPPSRRVREGFETRCERLATLTTEMCYSDRLSSLTGPALAGCGVDNLPVVLFVYPDVREHPKGDRP